MENDDNKPSRGEDLVIENFPGETVVYDQKRHRVHILKGDLAKVFDLCDGVKSTDEIAAQIASESDENSSEFVEDSIAVLEENSILRGSSRRDFLGKAAAAALAPLLVSIPVPAAAATLSSCRCATATSAGGASPTPCCQGVVTPGVSLCSNPAQTVGCTGGSAVSGNSIVCGTASCFEPATNTCSCRTNSGFCPGLAAGNTLTQRCCVGTDPTLTSPTCAGGIS